MNNDLYLAHHGIKGMHWGVRRYQNPDGSLTSQGKSRQNKNNKLKTAAKIGFGIAVTGLAAYGAYKYSDVIAKKIYSSGVKKSVSNIDFDNMGPEIHKRTSYEKAQKAVQDTVRKWSKTPIKLISTTSSKEVYNPANDRYYNAEKNKAARTAARKALDRYNSSIREVKYYQDRLQNRKKPYLTKDSATGKIFDSDVDQRNYYIKNMHKRREEYKKALKNARRYRANTKKSQSWVPYDEHGSNMLDTY